MSPRQLLRAFVERCHARHVLPYSEAELALLSQASVEGRALRRRRSRARRLLVKGSPS